MVLLKSNFSIFLRSHIHYHGENYKNKVRMIQDVICVNYKNDIDNKYKCFLLPKYKLLIFATKEEKWGRVISTIKYISYGFES